MIENTFDPIISETDYKMSLFPRVPIPDTYKCIILYSTDTQKKLVLDHNTKIKPTDIRKGKYNREIEIDMRQHPISFEQKYRCHDGLNEFLIRIRSVANVVDPELVWEKSIHNATEAVVNELELIIKNLSSIREMKEWKRLEDEIEAELREEVQLLCGISIKSVNVTVRMEEEIEKIYKNQDIEKVRKESAEILKELYKYEEDAIFAQAASGNITVQEATAMIKKAKNEDYYDNLQKLREAISVSREIKESDLVGNKRIEVFIESFLRASEKSGVGAEKLSASTVEQKRIEEKEDEIYKEFD